MTAPHLDYEGWSRFHTKSLTYAMYGAVFLGTMYGCSQIPNIFLKRARYTACRALHGWVVDVHPSLTLPQFRLLMRAYKARECKRGCDTTQMVNIARYTAIDSDHTEMAYALDNTPEFISSPIPFDARIVIESSRTEQKLCGTLFPDFEEPLDEGIIRNSRFWTKLPFVDSSVDTVFCAYGLSTRPFGHDKLISEMLRIVKSSRIPHGKPSSRTILEGEKPCVVILDWGKFLYTPINTVLQHIKKEFNTSFCLTLDIERLVEEQGGMILYNKRYFFGGLHVIVIMKPV